MARVEVRWHVWEEWAASMRRRGLSPGTVTKRRSELEAWHRFVDDGWRHATRGDVERWLDSRPLGVRARYAAISHLAAFYRWARREGMTTADPCEQVERPRLPRQLPRPARPAAVHRAIGAGVTPAEVGCALAAWAGLRCCEVARLGWDDVDLAAGELYVTGKGDRERVVPLCRDLLALLAAQDGTAGPVLGRRMTPARVSKMLNDHLRSVRAGCTAHQLRHAFATRLLRSSHDVMVVQAALGHASVATTQIYAAVAPDAVASALAEW